MNSTSFFSKLVNSAAKSLGFSSTGPLVWRKLTPSSCAMMCDSVVFPKPGGPNSSTWSIASFRILAAPMKISNCSRTLVCPTYSSNSLGRKARSTASSLGEAAAADMTRLSGGGRPKSSVWMLMCVFNYFDSYLANYFAKARSANLMPSLTLTSCGSAFNAKAASLSL